MSNRRRRGFVVPTRLRESATAEIAEAPAQIDRDKLKRYWTVGDGLAKWRDHPHPWRALYGHLKKHMPDEMAKRVASEWYREIFGHMPSQKASKESAVPATNPPATVRIAEANTATPIPTGARRFRARLIAGDMQGSSGYYSSAMLRESAPVFRAGLPVYCDHPSVSEEADRPERSVRDLAGRLITEARYTGDGLYADIEVYPHWAPVIEAMRDGIGMSIRASGTAEHGKPDGQRGPLITAITAAESVDFVTAAGAGGKIVALLESTRGLREATTAVVRAALDEALQDAYGDDRTYVYVRDFDADAGVVYYDVSSGGDTDTWEQAYTITTDPAPIVTLTGTATQVVAQTTYTPVADPDNPAEQPGDDGDSAGTTAATESLSAGTVHIDVRPTGASLAAITEAVRAEFARTAQTSDGAPPPANPSTGGMPSMSGAHNSGSAPGAQAGHTPTVGAPDAPRDLVVVEAQRQVAEMRLTEATNQAEALRTQLTEATQATALATARAERAEADLRQVRATEAARSQAVTALAGTDLPTFAHGKVIESVTRHVALTDTGAVDTGALTASITAAVEAERTYLAQAAQAAGAGTVTGLGTGTVPFAEADVAAWEKRTAERLGRLAGTNGKVA